MLGKGHGRCTGSDTARQQLPSSSATAAASAAHTGRWESPSAQPREGRDQPRHAENRGGSAGEGGSPQRGGVGVGGDGAPGMRKRSSHGIGVPVMELLGWSRSGGCGGRERLGWGA